MQVSLLVGATLLVFHSVKPYQHGITEGNKEISLESGFAPMFLPSGVGHA
jgi:hypothetical protein